MPLPPEFLRLKRKADDKETVELLYVQRECRDPRRSFTETRFKFQRVSHNDDSTNLQHPSGGTQLPRSSSSNNISQVPTVRTTLPGEEDFTPQPARTTGTGRYPQPPANLGSPISSQNRGSELIPQINRPKLSHRVFHLTHDSLSRSLQSRAPSDTRFQRHKSRKPDHYPVFSERRQKLQHQPVQLPLRPSPSNAVPTSSHDTMILDPPVLPPETTTTTTTPRKRPNATAAEKKWRASNWKTPPPPRVPNSQSSAPSQISSATPLSPEETDYESLKLALELQNFTLQQLSAAELSQSNQTQTNDVTTQRDRQKLGVRQQYQPLKFSPKPNPRRYAERQASAKASSSLASEPHVYDELTDAPDDEGDWVYDTYIRKPVNDDHEDDINIADAPGIGLLVIPEDEQEIWEAYGDEEEEEGFETDDDDENAEDYHANDYPSSELSSSDEFDRGNYDHRHAASDEEQTAEGVDFDLDGGEDGEGESPDEPGERQ